MFVWDNREQSEAELLTHYARLVEEYPVDLARVILGGFSMGAETALYLALKRRGILVRYFSGERTRAFIRVTIGTAEQMAEFLSAVREITGGLKA